MPVAQSLAYRVPRRFIPPPSEPAPYGLVVLSLVGHLMVLTAGVGLSTFLASHLDQSKIYVVNLVPAAPVQGAPAPAAPAPARETATPRTPPAPGPRAEERTPPRPAKVETPPLRAIPAPPRGAEPVAPPRTADLAPRATASRPADIALPRRAEKETPPLDTPGARERLVERPLPAPVPPSPPPPRLPEAPRVAPPQAPPQAPTLPVATVAAARPGVEAPRVGRPEPTSPVTPGNISLDVNDFPFTYYLRQIHAKINERWAPPRAGVTRGERAVVLFDIRRDGQIDEPRLERRSGSELYDQSALRAILDASPFPPLPPEFKGSHLRVHFGFDLETRMDQG